MNPNSHSGAWHPRFSPVSFALGLAAVVLTSCSDADKAAPPAESASASAAAAPSSEPVSSTPVETKEEKNARLEALYSQGEKKKQDSAHAERTAHAVKALSELTFNVTTAPSFLRAGGKALLDLDAQNYVPTSHLNADRYKTPFFGQNGSSAVTKSATLDRIEKAYAAKDWLALINLGAGTKHTSLPSVRSIDQAVKTLGLGIGLKVGRDPYQLHIYYPGPKQDLNYLAIRHDRRFGGAIGYGRGTSAGIVRQLPDTHEYVLRFHAHDIAPTLLVGPVDLKQGPLQQLNAKHTEIYSKIRARLAAGEIDKAEGARLAKAAQDNLKRVFLAWVAKN